MSWSSPPANALLSIVLLIATTEPTKTAATKIDMIDKLIFLSMSKFSFYYIIGLFNSILK
ncbi:protein of unknown function [Candidatus Nitrosocosmicus franklandus]|uniref:Uncharacterized protein n=1 Tax=Candidatus Nitrosocosmicus franklandianus TaxID=1798806 RepID=A0A484IA29_9ARCH|nr:protein of unknown function [Candidatus Nitrosocosmicus franklandus]